MKKFGKYITISVLVVAGTFALTKQVMAATTVNLGTAANFAVLGGTAVTDVPTSVITGDVGLSPASGSNYAGLTSAEVTGTIYAVDGAGPGGSVNNPALLTTAKNDLTAAYIDTAARTPTTTFVASDNQLGGKTLTPGVYAFGHATNANLTAASPLILDAQGDPNAVFIFQSSSDLVTASGSVVQLINGAQACNIFWQVTSNATLGTNSTFVGTLMALSSATLTTGVNVQGRILARNAQVALSSNTITKPTCTSGGSGGGSGSSGTTTSTTTPKLPNTGSGGTQPTSPIVWSTAIAASIIAILGSLYLVYKKRTA